MEQRSAQSGCEVADARKHGADRDGPERTARNGLLALVGVVVLALALRLAYLRQIESIPFFGHPVGDAASYTVWAQTIADGDWVGNGAFYQAPAYPYFLAAVYRAVGSGPWAIRVVQAVLGAVACGLLGGAAWLLFDRRVGVVAGVLTALYPPAIFFDGLIQKASLGLVLMAMLVLLLAWIGRAAGARGRWIVGRWAAAGFVLGLLTLTRENALVLAAPILVWLWVKFRHADVRARLVRTAGLVGAMAPLLLAVGIRNYRVGGEFALTTVQAGPNFYIGNSEIATGRYVAMKRGHESPPFERQDAKALAEQACGRTLSDGEVSRYWWRQAYAFIREHPGRWLALVGRKMLLVWNAFEIADTECYYLYCDWSPLLGVLGTLWHFGVLCPLAAAGMVLTWPRRRELWWLHLLIAALACAVAAFYVVARYRYPLVPLLVPFGGAALVYGYDQWRAKQARALVAAVLVAAAVAVVANLRASPERRLKALSLANVGSVLAQEGNLEAATRYFELAVDGAADSAEVHYSLGQAYALQGRFADAAARYGRALELEPGLTHADYNLGVALEALGRAERAIEHYRQALAVDANDADARAAVARLAGARAPSE